MKYVLIPLMVVLSMVCSGCNGMQADIQGPALTFKIFGEKENNDNVHLSRSAGMTGGNGYSSHGLAPTGNSGNVASWGTLK